MPCMPIPIFLIPILFFILISAIMCNIDYLAKQSFSYFNLT